MRTVLGTVNKIDKMLYYKSPQVELKAYWVAFSKIKNSFKTK